jgi:ATP-binding cassette subfamily G (WHITE) protein 2 (PDR)
MAPYIEQLGGYLTNLTATTECEFCVIADTSTFLSSAGVDYGDRWRNFGILWGYVIFNVLVAVLLYWGVRVPKKRREKRFGKEEHSQGEIIRGIMM